MILCLSLHIYENNYILLIILLKIIKKYLCKNLNINIRNKFN